MSVKKVTNFRTNNITVMNILNSQIETTKYAFGISTYNLVKDQSIIKIEKPVLRNSQIPLLSVKGIS